MMTRHAGQRNPHTLTPTQRHRHLSVMTDETDAILSLLPARLKEARRVQGLSLDAVAKLSGVSRSMVSQDRTWRVFPHDCGRSGT